MSVVKYAYMRAVMYGARRKCKISPRNGDKGNSKLPIRLFSPTRQFYALDHLVLSTSKRFNEHTREI